DHRSGGNRRARSWCDHCCHGRRYTERGIHRRRPVQPRSPVQNRSRNSPAFHFLSRDLYRSALVAHMKTLVRPLTIAFLAALVWPLASRGASPVLYESSLGCAHCCWRLVLVARPTAHCTPSLRGLYYWL